jgi:anti-sigma regulatory factor (Ser/Thr protein kinase)
MEPAGNWTLPPDTTAPGVARRIVASALTAWRDPDDAVLVASELVTNAVQHGLPPIELNLHLGTGRLRLTVSNAVGTTLSVPRIVAPGADEPDGRGLAIVETLSTEWGWSDTDRMISVWAELIDSTVIDLAAMSGTHNCHRETFVEYLVDDTVVTHADPPGHLFPRKLP